MPRGDKSKYTDKQQRKADHIAEGYEKRGVKKKTAEARAWATVNKMTGGGKKSGSGRGKKVNKSPAKKGGTAPATVTTGTSVSGKVVATAGSRAPYLAIGWARSCLFGAEELARYEGLLENGMIVPVSR